MRIGVFIFGSEMRADGRRAGTQARRDIANRH
jgi:hypothetical protein